MPFRVNRHIESMYQSFDPAGVGQITLEQYQTAMKTLGVDNYDAQPLLNDSGCIDKETFVLEA